MPALRRLPVILLILLPVVLVGVTVLYYAVNFPYWDDYIIQDHLLTIKATGSLRQKIARFFDQHWEHRILWTRIIFYLFAKLTGSLNYYGLTLLGVSGLLGVLGIFYAAFRKTGLPLTYFIPVPFWLFTLQSHENLLWAMASLQNFYVLVFAFGTFYLLAQENRRNRILAMLLALLATFTSGNGALVLIAGLVVLASQRHWRATLLWALATAIGLGLYFFDYHRTTFFPSANRYPYTDWINAFFVFLGGFTDIFPYSGAGALGYTNPLAPGIALGVVLVVSTLYYLLHLFSQQFRSRVIDFWDAFFIGATLFLLATTLITVYSRVGFGGPAYLLQGRYKVYSALMISVVYLYSINHWRQSRLLRWPVGLVIISTIFLSLLSSYLCLEGIINQHRKTVAGYFSWQQEHTADQRKGIEAVYVPTELPFFGAGQRLSNPANLTVDAATQLDSIVEQPILFSVIQDGVPNPTPARPDDGTYIILARPSLNYLFPARAVRPSPLSVTKLADYFTPNQIHAQILKENVKEGRYRIGLVTNRAGDTRVLMTNQYITVTSPY